MILELNNLSIGVANPHKEIVKSLNLKVGKGEIFVLIGESGSGKSMTIKALMGIINRQTMQVSGQINYEGTDLLAMPEKARRKLAGDLALIMQNPMSAFNPSMKIGKQMILNFSDTKKSKADLLKKAEEVLRAVNLEPEFVMKSYPNELSGGMLQRVMIAIALMSEAKILVADEPTTALDVVNQEYILEEFLKLKEKGLSILLVTHDFYVAKKIADHVAVIKNGEIIEYGTIDEIVDNPKSDYTKLLIHASTYYTDEGEIR